MKTMPLHYLSLLLLLPAGDVAFACTPCPSVATLGETINSADLVVLGQSAGQEKSWFSEDKYISVTVKTVLKGKADGKRLKIRAWYGMCPYGLQLAQGETAVIYLKKDAEGYEVATSCGHKADIVRDGKLNIDGQILTVDAYKAKYFPA